MVWAAHHADRWPDLDAREEPTEEGRRLEVGGFVFGDRPELLFRGIDPAYINAAWQRLGAVLGRHEVVADDLSWGVMHPGETAVAGVRCDDPCRFIGWTATGLAAFDTDPRWDLIDTELGGVSPFLRCAVTWRSLRWRIGGEETAIGLRLFEALATDEYSDWSPQSVLTGDRDESEPWVRAAAAVRDVDQQALDRALSAAERSYSVLGYRIVVRGYQAYALGLGLALRFPVPPG